MLVRYVLVHIPFHWLLVQGLILGEANELLMLQNLTLKPVQYLAKEFHIRLTNLAIEVSFRCFAYQLKLFRLPLLHMSCLV